MKRFVVVLALCFIPMLASAKSLNAGYVGCISKEALDEFTQASVRKDERGMKYLIGKKCVFTAQLASAEMSVLDRGFVTSKVRVYVGNDALELYVPSEAVR
jgi:hypothetical protein